MKLTLSNIRSFYGRHTVDLRKLNVVIGENSSGKSTLLAVINAALQFDFPAGKNVFNAAPFELGSFETIATFRGGRSGREASFSIGGVYKGDSETSVEAVFGDVQGAPTLTRLEMDDGSIKVDISISHETITGTVDAKRSGQKVSFNTTYTRPLVSTWESLSQTLVSSILSVVEQRATQGRAQLDVARQLFLSLSSFRDARPSVKALAPLRTKPKRTYDETSDEFTPEGNHIPRVMANMIRTQQPSHAQELFFESLDAFGKASGLYSAVSVKQLGPKAGDPFQIRVKTAGPLVNLVDVGYGVSQALPIIADVLLSPADQVLLIQQPEVHLHPRAQAALGSFFAKRASLASAPMVIETHSDYLVDRVRLEVARETIKAEDVSILFLDRTGPDTTIHPISIDSGGNIVDAPSSYRRFFLEEEDRLLFRTSNVPDR